MLLVAFLTIFGLGGIVLQGLVKGIFGSYLPSWIAVPVVSVGSLLLLRAVGGVLSRVIPMEETDAVTEDSFVGLVATITLGTARQGEPAQAKLRDRMAIPTTSWWNRTTRRTRFPRRRRC